MAPPCPSPGHAWALGAFASLIDTSRAAARRSVRISVGDLSGAPHILFRDDGLGMDGSAMEALLGHAPDSPATLTTAASPWLGAAFRLGKDVCVVSAGGGRRTVGINSSTARADAGTGVAVFEWEGKPHALLEYCPWDTAGVNGLFESLENGGSVVAIMNLRMDEDGVENELDFYGDDTDILLDPPESEGVPLSVHTSLRSYLQVLYYAKPGAGRAPRLYLRGKVVRELRVVSSMLCPRDFFYTPRDCPPGRLTYRLGVNASYASVAPGSDASAVERRDAGCRGDDDDASYPSMTSDQDWGILVYCRGRLVWSYLRFPAHEAPVDVGAAVQPPRKMRPMMVRPILGVVEADAWEVSANAQDFAITDLLKRGKGAIDRAIANYSARYWSTTVSPDVREQLAEPLARWVRCDTCDAWRCVPEPPVANMCDVRALPQWSCAMNRGGNTECDGRDDQVDGIGLEKDKMFRVSGFKKRPRSVGGKVGGTTSLSVVKRARPLSLGPGSGASDGGSALPIGAAGYLPVGMLDSGSVVPADGFLQSGSAADAYAQSLDNGEDYVPELDLNVETPGPPDEIEIEGRQEELDRLHVDDRLDGSTDANAALVGDLNAETSPAGSGVEAVDEEVDVPVGDTNGESLSTTAQKEAAVALVSMNRFADSEDDDCKPATHAAQTSSLGDQKKTPQAESDEVRDVIAGVEEREQARNEAESLKTAEKEGGGLCVEKEVVGGGGCGEEQKLPSGITAAHFPRESAVISRSNEKALLEAGPTGNGLMGDGGVAALKEFVGETPAIELEASQRPGHAQQQTRAQFDIEHHHLNGEGILMDQVDIGSYQGAEEQPAVDARMGEAAEHQSEGSKGPSHPAADVQGHQVANGGAVVTGSVPSGSGSGNMQACGEAGRSGSNARDGNWRALFLKLAALVDSEGSNGGSLPPLHNVNLDDAEDVVDDLRRTLAASSKESSDARAEQAIACEQLDGVRRLIRVFLERGVGIVRPEDDEDEPIESHFSSYLRMIDCLDPNSDLS